MTNKLLIILAFATLGNLLQAEALQKGSNTNYQKMIKDAAKKHSEKVGKNEEIAEMKSNLDEMKNYPEYQELSGYLVTVLKKIKDDKKLYTLIRRFVLGYLDPLLENRFTEEHFSRFRKKMAKNNQTEEENKDSAAIKLLDANEELLLDCLRKAYDGGYAEGWGYDDWKIHWAVVFLYATNFNGLPNDVVENIKFHFDGWDG